MAKVTAAHLQSRRDQILSAATTCFARRGCAQSTMQDVAAEAGMSVGALYRYFPGKDDLISEVFDGIGQRTSMLFTRAAEGTSSPGDVLRRTGRILEERFFDEKTRAETILVLEAILADAREPSATGASGGRQLREAYVFLTERLFRQAQEEGSLDPVIDARGLASLFVSLVVGVHVLRLEFGDALDLKPLLAAVDEVLYRMGPADEYGVPAYLPGGDENDLAVPIGGRE